MIVPRMAADFALEKNVASKNVNITTETENEKKYKKMTASSEYSNTELLVTSKIPQVVIED
jgi:hypothetical protein